MSITSPYDALGGEQGIRQLCKAFYIAMDSLPEAAHIRRMHDDSLVEVEEKLFEYLSGWLGGPPLYSKKYGSVCLTDPHKPYAIGPAARDQWLLCMDSALEKVGASEELKALIKEPLFGIANAVKNQDHD